MIKLENSFYFRRLSVRLLQGSALAGLVAISSTGALAQDASGGVETVTVTGTAIRGATAPIGSNIITMDRDAIEATNADSVQQLLTNMPAVTQFGNAGQGSYAFDPAGASAPSIHSIGASASNSTLVLIDGDRIPLAGISHSQADPSTIPTIAIQRVEVLPDGASAIYGSDAVAGVINFITRTDYQGAETDIEYGAGLSYNSFNFGQIIGTVWDHGSVMAAYNYTSNAQLAGSNRSYVNDIQTFRGLSNLGNFNCSPATISSTSTGPIFAYPYSGASVADVSTNAYCGQTRNTSILPSENRNALLVKMREDLTDWLSVSADLNWSNRLDSQAISRGVATATVFGPGSGKGGQINPFFVGVPGSTTGVETVRYDFNQLLGPGANSKFGTEVLSGHLNANVKLGGDWYLSVDGLSGATQSFTRTVGAVCTACAYLALNGTTNASGNLATSSSPVINGTTNYTTRVPLTTANALNVWSSLGSTAAGGADTSSAILNQLTDNNNFSQTRQNMNDVNIRAGGTIINDGAGDIKTSFGVEYRNYGINEYAVQNGASGPSSTNSTIAEYNLARNVYAVYAEFLVPLVNEGMGIPLVRKVDLDISGRYDHYSDFGDTHNPKVGLNWEIVDGLKARGSYSTSFVAPALTSVGNSAGLTTESAVTYGTASSAVAIPAGYPNNGGGNSTIPAGFCSAGCTIGNSTNAGIIISGPGGKSARAQTALTYSGGVDIDAGKLWSPLGGFTFSASYWQAKFIGAITNPIIQLDVSLPGLNKNLIVAPSNAQVAAAYNSGLRVSAVPSGPITFLQYATQQNAYNLYTNGVDLAANYAFDMGHYGDVMLGIDSSLKLRVSQQGGGYGAPITNNLNINANNTFSSLANLWRASFGWHLDPVSAQFIVNYENPYYEPTAVTPFTGLLRVPANVTVDATLSYILPAGLSYASGAQVYITGQNIFNVPPPPYNVAVGYDTMDASPLGRIVMFGLRKKW